LSPPYYRFSELTENIQYIVDVIGSSKFFMGKLNTLQNAWRGHGPRPTDLILIKAFTVAVVLDLGKATHTKIKTTVLSHKPGVFV